MPPLRTTKAEQIVETLRKIRKDTERIADSISVIAFMLLGFAVFCAYIGIKFIINQ